MRNYVHYLILTACLCFMPAISQAQTLGARADTAWQHTKRFTTRNYYSAKADVNRAANATSRFAKRNYYSTRDMAKKDVNATKRFANRNYTSTRDMANKDLNATKRFANRNYTSTRDMANRTLHPSRQTQLTTTYSTNRTYASSRIHSTRIRTAKLHHRVRHTTTYRQAHVERSR